MEKRKMKQIDSTNYKKLKKKKVERIEKRSKLRKAKIGVEFKE